jgi:hypothetical protein
LPDDGLKLDGKSSGTAAPQPPTDIPTQCGSADGGGDDKHCALPIELPVGTKNPRGEGAEQAHGAPHGALGASAPPKLVVESPLPQGSLRRIQPRQLEFDLAGLPQFVGTQLREYVG